VLLMAYGRKGNGTAVWDEWKKNTLHAHEVVYPDILAVTWSGPDSVQSVRGPQPGAAEPKYGLHNAWSHTTPMITLLDLVGE
jgi:hypothetical protein